MLSVLIPTYNYNALPLVKEIEKQCIEAGIIFEILCQDDASNSELNIENEKINALSDCYFYCNDINLGRGKNINLLASKARYNYLLLMDCDTMPTQNNYILSYIKEINKETLVVFGGIVYQTEKPKQEELLRWVYGRNRESLSVEKRKKKPYQTSLTSNLLILKKVFSSFNFNENILNYGYEDLVFMNLLKKNAIPINHIQNTTCHLNLETSSVFLKKIKVSLESLSLIYNLKLLNENDNKILKTYKLLKIMRLNHFFSLLFTNYKSRLEKNLLSNNPKMLLLDLYKLGYFCKILC